jgi:hypothetical protein
MRWLNNILYSNQLLLPAVAILATDQDEEDKLIAEFVSRPDYQEAISASYLERRKTFWEKW